MIKHIAAEEEKLSILEDKEMVKVGNLTSCNHGNT